MENYIRSQVLSVCGLFGKTLPEIVSVYGVKAVSLPQLARYLGLRYESLLYRSKGVMGGLIIDKDYFHPKGGLLAMGNPRVLFSKSGTEALLSHGYKKLNLRALDIILEIIFEQEVNYFICPPEQKPKKPKSLASRRVPPKTANKKQNM